MNVSSSAQINTYVNELLTKNTSKMNETRPRYQFKGTFRELEGAYENSCKHFVVLNDYVGHLLGKSNSLENKLSEGNFEELGNIDHFKELRNTYLKKKEETLLKNKYYLRLNVYILQFKIFQVLVLLIMEKKNCQNIC